MINRCICYDISFAEILKKSIQNKWTAEEAKNEVGCGSACGMCFPYIVEVLKTRITEFPVDYRLNK